MHVNRLQPDENDDNFEEAGQPTAPPGGPARDTGGSGDKSSPLENLLRNFGVPDVGFPCFVGLCGFTNPRHVMCHLNATVSAFLSIGAVARLVFFAESVDAGSVMGALQMIVTRSCLWRRPVSSAALRKALGGVVQGGTTYFREARDVGDTLAALLERGLTEPRAGELKNMLTTRFVQHPDVEDGSVPIIEDRIVFRLSGTALGFVAAGPEILLIRPHLNEEVTHWTDILVVEVTP
jgi:hypothetical protein